MRTSIAAMVSWSALVLAAGCGSSSSTDTPVKGRGTLACNAWQTAICDWASKCSAPNAAACVDQANGVTCISDEKAQSCATAIAATGCTSVPAGCNLPDLPDPAPAQAACQKFVDTACSATMRCNSTISADSCQQQIKAALDCTQVNSVKLTFEQCISELTTLSCDASESPAICKGVLVSIQ
jgi:hypothetical protein